MQSGMKIDKAARFLAMSEKTLEDVYGTFTPTFTGRPPTPSAGVRVGREWVDNYAVFSMRSVQFRQRKARKLKV